MRPGFPFTRIIVSAKFQAKLFPVQQNNLSEKCFYFIYFLFWLKDVKAKKNRSMHSSNVSTVLDLKQQIEIIERTDAVLKQLDMVNSELGQNLII